MEKIYITSLHMLHGGVEMAITLLANALVKRGYEVEILCTYHLGNPVYHLNDKVKITYLTDVHPNKTEFKEAVRRKNPIKIIAEAIYAVRVLGVKKKTLVEQFRQIEEGIIISTRNEHSVLLSKYGKSNVKKIAQLHHDHEFNRKLMKDFASRYHNIDYFVLLTDLLKTEVQEMMRTNHHTECVVIPNFLEKSSERENMVRERQIITVGRLHTVKGYDRLIQMWSKLQFTEPTVLKLIGDGEERENLEKLIQQNHLEDRVVMTGALEHECVMEEMRKSLFYVMTSYSEAFPFVLIEAMENGLPVVAFDVRVGPRAIVEDGKSGFLIPDSNEQVFIDKIKVLGEDRTIRERMSEEAVLRSKEFAEEQVMEKWIHILEA